VGSTKPRSQRSMVAIGSAGEVTGGCRLQGRDRDPAGGLAGRGPAITEPSGGAQGAGTQRLPGPPRAGSGRPAAAGGGAGRARASAGDRLGLLLAGRK
jgi:hypothetical protein